MATTITPQEQRQQLFQRLSLSQQLLDHYEISAVIVEILNNYLADNHFAQAYQFLSSSVFPPYDKVDQHVLRQFIYNKALIYAVYEEYTESLAELYTIVRLSTAVAENDTFYLTIVRLFVLVSLLVGQIPEKTMLESAYIKKSLEPQYFAIITAVREGDVDKFSAVVSNAENIALFKTHGVYPFITRLPPTIVRAGLIKLTTIYTTIPVSKVGTLLNIPQEDVHAVVNKAIFDGVISARVDEQDVLHTINPKEQYMTAGPKATLVKKINHVQSLYQQCQQGKKYLEGKDNTNTITDGKERVEKI